MGRSTHRPSSRQIGGQQAEVGMHMRHSKPIAVFLGIGAGALTIAGTSASPAYAQWVGENPATVSECSSPLVDDAATVAGNCLVNNVQQAFVRLPSARASTFLAPLASTVGGAPCAATAMNNAAAGSESVMGGCADGNSVIQGVMWDLDNPTAAPTVLQPISVLGLLPDVQTEALAIDTQGMIAGVSINSTGTETPVVWSPAGVATALAPALLSSNANCVPYDINDAAPPSIIGNCSDAGTGGGNKAVLWQGPTSAYTILPIPTGANYCTVSDINFSGQILGECIYGDDSWRAAFWGSGGTGPIVLSTVGGVAAAHTYSADLNDNGLVAGGYVASGASAGFIAPCTWDPTRGSTNAVAISLPGGATGPGFIQRLGNDGKIIGNYETAGGLILPFHVEPGSSVAVSDGSPAGGPSAVAISLSKSGTNEAIASEDSSGHEHVEERPVP
jgi:hypothetical protein